MKQGINSGLFPPPRVIWACVKIKPPGPQVLVFGSIYQGNPFWVPIFDPQPYDSTRMGQ